MREIEVLSEAGQLVAANPMAILWFSAPDCGVCDVLRPRVEELMSERFPRIETARIDLARLPEAVAEYQVLTIPTLICFFDGREGKRFSRNFALGEVGAALERVYQICFGD